MNRQRIYARAASSDGALRSKLLKLVMPHLSGEMGTQLARALDEGDDETFMKLWTEVTNNIVSQVRETGK